MFPPAILIHWVADQWCSDLLIDWDTLALVGAVSRTFWVVYFTVVV